MKLFTTATALAQLGPETRIPTRVFADGSLDADGVLHGNLYLQGGGDPTLGTPTFYNGYLAGLGTNLFALTPQIKAAGITRSPAASTPTTRSSTALRGVADSGYATSPYIGPLSGLAFNSGFGGSTSSSGFSADPAKLAASKLAALAARRRHRGADAGRARRRRRRTPNGSRSSTRPPSTRSSTPPTSTPTTSSPRR